MGLWLSLNDHNKYIGKFETLDTLDEREFTDLGEDVDRLAVVVVLAGAVPELKSPKITPLA
jgi:hypothetical protein